MMQPDLVTEQEVAPAGADQVYQLPDLRNKAFCIFGPRGSGKTELARFIVSHFRSPIVWDYMGEYSNVARVASYYPSRRMDLMMQLDQFIWWALRQEPDLIMIDEANRVIVPKPAPLPNCIGEINDMQRHKKLCAGYIARRPVQLNTDVIELAEYLMIFQLRGKNDIQYLNDLSMGLGDALGSLPLFHFILVNPNRSFQQFPPIRMV